MSCCEGMVPALSTGGVTVTIGVTGVSIVAGSDATAVEVAGSDVLMVSGSVTSGEESLSAGCKADAVGPVIESAEAGTGPVAAVSEEAAESVFSGNLNPLHCQCHPQSCSPVQFAICFWLGTSRTWGLWIRGEARISIPPSRKHWQAAFPTSPPLHRFGFSRFTG